MRRGWCGGKTLTVRPGLKACSRPAAKRGEFRAVRACDGSAPGRPARCRERRHPAPARHGRDHRPRRSYPIPTDTAADLAPGQAGELWVRTPAVMTGYLGNPAASAATIDEDGWLNTGDIARFDADGNLFLLDRLKELIKVKGFQVAPAELEAILRSHPAVADAAVIPVPDERAGELPKAYVVPAPAGHAARTDRLRGRAGRPAQAHPPGVLHRRHPHLPIRQDATPAPDRRRTAPELSTLRPSVSDARRGRGARLNREGAWLAQVARLV